MNIFQLVLKQMRQRALGTWLTLLSVTLGVALAVAIMIVYREGDTLFGAKTYGYEVIVGKKGSPVQLVMNTVYHLDVSPGAIPYADYESMFKEHRADVKIAVPYAVGDTYQGQWRIVGTLPKLFGLDDETGQPLPPEKVLEYRPGERFHVAQGKVFAANRFEAIIGSEVAEKSGLKIGSTFQATHGMPRPEETPDIHPEIWTVVGILEPTHSANDRVLFIPLLSFYTIGEHSIALKAEWYIANHLPPPPATAEADDVKAYTLNDDGTFKLLVPKEHWEVSAILVKARSDFAAQNLIYMLKNGTNVMAVNPASEMRTFLATFVKGPTVALLVIACLVTVVAAIGILVSIYNSVAARMKEIAILRALGATRTRVLLLICLEAGLIGLFGGLLGLLTGHVLAGVGNVFFRRFVGQNINWISTSAVEWYYVAGVVVIAVLAGLVPALKAYRSPVATNLVAS